MGRKDHWRFAGIGKAGSKLLDNDKEVKTMAIDPVCGMEVDEKKIAAIYDHKGKTYYFCTQGCKEKFSKEPEKFLDDENR